ncbi:MAG: hypothetical protein FJ147_00125 [Deltaproteobacteria bacterium]|nr:hypothetical protein [Deltaproteobacteria bacterium]
MEFLICLGCEVVKGTLRLMAVLPAYQRLGLAWRPLLGALRQPRTHSAPVAPERVAKATATPHELFSGFGG